MLNKYFSLKLLFLIKILITVFGDNIDVSVGQSTGLKDSPEQRTTTEEIAILLPDKGPVPLPQITGLANLPGPNSSEKVFGPGKDKQIIESHVRTRVILHTEVDAVYNCTQDSVLSLLTLHSEFDNYFTCNQVLDIPHDNKLNATLRKSNRKSSEPYTTPITTYDSSVKLIFYKGNQMYYSTGIVEDGQCSGDKLTILNVSLVKKGSCKLRSGVQQIVSDYAQLTLSGNCQSTCFGDVNISISPGLRN